MFRNDKCMVILAFSLNVRRIGFSEVSLISLDTPGPQGEADFAPHR